MKKLCVVIALLVASTIGSYAQSKGKVTADRKLKGSWSWVKSYYHTKDTSFVWHNIRGRMIFDEGDYSFLIIDQQTPRAPLKEGGWNANSKEDLQKALSKVVANMGTYHIRGDSLALSVEIAQWPNAMMPGRKPIKYGISWNADTLVLTRSFSTEYWLRRK